MTEMNCDQLHELGPELALGLVAGSARAAALAHLNRCAACREDIAELTAVGDALLALVPGAEPPSGFESRVLARLPRPAGRAKRRRWTAAIAAGTAAVVFGTGGWLLGAVTTASPPVPAAPAAPAATALLTADLIAGNHPVGQMWVHPGQSPWIYVSVDTEMTDRTVMVDCQLIRRDGTTVDVGTFDIVRGYGQWATPIPVDPAQLRGAQLLSAQSIVLATATFPA
ncbi:anti-sigma factor family protein [Amycolatopsis pigmentata]|uniref:Anti-sigma factor family protein n=1 Tax=Amycolatopsis pigmentata TaxID=450801 RepID=A0ABW5FZ48_9PSEU